MPAIGDAFRKLSPRTQFRNPVMFVVFVCSILTTLLWFQALGGHGEWVERPEEVRPALERALGCGKPALVNVRIGASDFRKDAISV